MRTYIRMCPFVIGGAPFMELKINKNIQTNHKLFIENSISQILLEQFNYSQRIKVQEYWIGFCFYYEYAFILITNKEDEINFYDQINYDTMIPDSFLNSLYEHTSLLPFHYKNWLADSYVELIRKDIAQSLLFNRLNLIHDPSSSSIHWNWKSHNISLQMNSSFVFEDIGGFIKN